MSTIGKKKTKSLSVSIFVPAYNEQGNITEALHTIEKYSQSLKEYEIIVIDDGSTDNTSLELAKYAKGNRRIRIIRNTTNLGIGAGLRLALSKACYEYFSVFPGDNDMAGWSLEDLFVGYGKTDLIVAYPRDVSVRGLGRMILSSFFVLLMNVCSGVTLKYYNGPFVCKTGDLSRIRLVANGYLIYAELKVKLILQGATVTEIPFDHVGRKYGVSKAITSKTVLETLSVFFHLLRYRLWN